MKSKLLLFAIVALAITSCSTAYKSGQTPDDVYYSPARFEENKDDKDDKQDQAQQTAEDRRVRQTIRDRRWRDLDEYDYTYNNSPYNHCYCNCPNYGYYYNPYYNPTPIFSTTTIKNTTPRKINLSSYQGYNTVKITPSKIGTTYKTTTSAPKYNNSNRKESLGSKIIKVFTSRDANSSNTNSNNSSGSNNTKTYTPSSSSSSSSSSSGSSGGSITRPARGGN